MTTEIKTYTPEELANELKIPRRTVLRAIRNKELECVKFSSCVFRILEADAQAWIESLKEPMPPAKGALTSAAS